ncbi:DUF6747 family protein [Maribacter litopenaei]
MIMGNLLLIKEIYIEAFKNWKSFIRRTISNFSLGLALLF